MCTTLPPSPLLPHRFEKKGLIFEVSNITASQDSTLSVQSKLFIINQFINTIVILCAMGLLCNMVM